MPPKWWVECLRRAREFFERRRLLSERTRPPCRIRWTVRRTVTSVLLLGILARWLWSTIHDATVDPLVLPLVPGEYRVVSVADDATLIVSKASLKQVGSPELRASASASASATAGVARLLGIRAAADRYDRWSTADSQLAADWLRPQLVGQTARLEFDRRRFDSSGHWLVYVYVGERLVNEDLLRSGWASCDNYPGDSSTMQRRFRRAESEARRARRGRWVRRASELVEPSRHD